MIFAKVATAAACLGLCASASLVPASVAAERRLLLPTNLFPDKRYPAPSKDSFYIAPANLSAYKEGDIIREREITKDLLPGVDSTVVGHAFQLLFKTQTSLGNPDVAVTVVFKPKEPAPGPAKVLSLALFVDAPVFDCSSSALTNGYYVTSPDFQGSQAAFIAGYGSGRGQLDGTRAILRHAKTIAEPAGHSIIFAGYSGGAHGAAWASQLKEEYASELNVIGASIGGTPADLKLCSILINLNGNLFGAVAVAALGGIANAYPEFKDWLLRTVNDTGRKLFAQLNSDKKCLLQITGKYAFLDYFSLVPNGEATVEEELPQRYFELNRLGARGDKDIIRGFPMFIHHSTSDQLIPERPVSAYVQAQCDGGANIDYATAAGSEHLSQAIVGFPASIAWIVKRFDGTLEQDGCRRSKVSVMDASSPSFNKIAGPKAAAQTRNNLHLKFF